MKNTEKKELMEIYIAKILKNYKNTTLVFVVDKNKIMISRNNHKCFYHFHFNDFSISSSYWSNHKWIDLWINL